MNDKIKRDEPSDQDKLTMLVGYLAVSNSIWEICERVAAVFQGGMDQMFDAVVAETKENCDEPGELLEIMQNSANAASVSCTREVSNTSRAKKSGATTKRFFTHWWGRSVRIMPRSRQRRLPRGDSGRMGGSAMGLM